MKTSHASPALSLALALVLVPGAAGAGARQDHHAAHAGDATPATQRDRAADNAAPGPEAAVPANHVKWTPDAPLVKGMGDVRRAMAQLEHLSMGHLGAGDVRTLATDIDVAIEYMFANCRLDPEPDVALHGVLARLMAGTQALRLDPADASPLAGMREAMEDYGRLFDDPARAAAPPG
jgi:hypothetical protein